MDLQTDDALRQFLGNVHTIAVLGIKAGETEEAFRVPRHMQACGFRILPVNPRLQEVLGEPCVPTLGDVREPIDLVNVFRAPQHIPGHVDEILALAPRPRAVWLQLGIRDDASAARLEAEGIAVVQDRCLMLDQRRLGVRPA